MRYKNLARTLCVLLTPLMPMLAHAGANDYVTMPTVEQGEREIDFKWGTQKNRDGTSEAATSMGLGYGVNAWWFSELYVQYKRPPGQTNSFDAWEWENRFQLTETGKYPLDLGFILELERPKDRTEGYELTYGPLLQSEWGNAQGNLNLLIVHHVRASEDFNTELHYQGQLKYRQSPQFEWGIQAFGSMGQWNHWAARTEQEHKWGPAVFGKIRIGTHEAIKWNAAFLHGTSNATPTSTLRFQAEYEF